MGAPLLRSFKEILGDFSLFNLVALLGWIPVHGLHAHQINDALEGCAATNWNLNGDCVCAQARLQAAEGEVKVSAEFVHLVDQAQTRNAVAISLAPHGFTLRFNAFLAVKNSDRAVKHAQRSFHFNCEIHVARRVDQIHLVFNALIFPWASGRGTLNGDAALLFFLKAVHGGGAFMHFTHAMDLAGVEKNALRHGGLASVNVGANSDVSNLVQINGHV